MAAYPALCCNLSEEKSGRIPMGIVTIGTIGAIAIRAAQQKEVLQTYSGHITFEEKQKTYAAWKLPAYKIEIPSVAVK